MKCTVPSKKENYLSLQSIGTKYEANKQTIQLH